MTIISNLVNDSGNRILFFRRSDAFPGVENPALPVDEHQCWRGSDAEAGRDQFEPRVVDAHEPGKLRILIASIGAASHHHRRAAGDELDELLKVRLSLPARTATCPREHDQRPGPGGVPVGRYVDVTASKGTASGAWRSIPSACVTRGQATVPMSPPA